MVDTRETRDTRETHDGKVEPPPLLARMVFGLILGAITGVCFAGWEAAVASRLGLGVPTDGLGQVVLALYAGTGAVFGALVAGLGRTGGAWAFMTMALASGWLVWESWA